ncbi:MAG: hypothetical protein ACLP4R_08685 [Solirubrobacteraceae bacterium]
MNRRKIDLIPGSQWEDPPKARIGPLLKAVENRLAAVGVAGLPETVEIARAAAAEAGLADPKVTGDAKHVEIGLTDKSDSGRWVMSWLWQRGIAPEQVLIAGDQLGPLAGVVAADVVWIGGGPDAFAAVLEDQIARRRHGELPIVVQDPEWTLAIDGVDPVLERVHESLLTLADGRLGTRGSVIAGHPTEDATVLMSGVYTRTGAETHLLTGPRWNTISVSDSPLRSVRRVLDLHAGVLQQQLRSQIGETDALLLSSLARPGTAALRVRDHRASMHPSQPLVARRTHIRRRKDGRVPVDARPQATGVNGRGSSRSAAGQRR